MHVLTSSGLEHAKSLGCLAWGPATSTDQTSLAWAKPRNLCPGGASSRNQPNAIEWMEAVAAKVFHKAQVAWMELIYPKTPSPRTETLKPKPLNPKTNLVLIMGTPKMVPLILGNPHVVLQSTLNPTSWPRSHVPMPKPGKLARQNGPAAHPIQNPKPL